MSAPGESPTTDPTRFRDALRSLYDALEADVARIGPVCELSGRCCRFAEYGHTLFVSTAETALLLADAPPPVRPLDAGASCPWQDVHRRCTARSARPLGCRVYFCDPSFATHAAELSEAYITRLKHLADAHGLPWNYAPLHQHLRRAELAGQFVAPLSRGVP